MVKKLAIIVFIIGFQSVLGQKNRADRYFEAGDYLNAAEFYELQWKKDNSKETLQKLAICYYNTFQYEKAIQSLAQLFNGRFKEEDKYYDNKYNFMHYQFLSAVGDYERAIDYLVLFKNNRGILPPRKDEAREEVETFKLKKADYEIKKAPFNSDAADFGALKLGDSIYFTSDRGNANDKKYNWTHRPFLDIYSFGVNKENKAVGEPSSISSSINSSLHEGSFCFSKSGDTLYLSKSDIEEGKAVFDEDNNNNVQLFISVKRDGKWQKPTKLPFSSSEYTFEHPTLSPDGKRLYFSSNVLGSVGEYDIYYVTINGDGTYGTLKNLSYIVNTENREQFPYISEEGHLFFSSNGHLGLGMLDVFVSEWKDGKFSKPINLGAPINSRYDDFGMRYNDIKTGYFASNRDDKNDDVYSFEQTGEIFKREYINQFEVRDMVTHEYIPNSEVVLYLNDSIVYQNTLDSIARFNSNLLPGTYTYEVRVVGYLDKVMVVDAKDEQDQKHVILLVKNETALIEDIIKDKSVASQEVIKLLLADPDPPRIISKDGKLYFDMPPIYFDFDRWEIRSDSKKILDGLTAKMIKYPSLQIKISAHTDNRGTDIYNQVLSEKRAESTRNYLSTVGGVDARRMSFKGYGESIPLMDCSAECSEVDHQKNRRSEFEIIKY
ncbi:OmpA family protein [Sediminicola sp. 1XM1-17]|uniref:OmpA family protein n=1 Tax=Sediminicola sp. 1XM1-17 TaxID=3127702 RepID=UPI003076EE0F